VTTLIKTLYFSGFQVQVTSNITNLPRNLGKRTGYFLLTNNEDMLKNIEFQPQEFWFLMAPVKQQQQLLANIRLDSRVFLYTVEYLTNIITLSEVYKIAPKVRVIIVGKKSKQDSIILKTFCREKCQAKICEVPCRASTCLSMLLQSKKVLP
jgi:hypothetical protein